MEDVDPDPQLAQLTAEMVWLKRLARALLRNDDAQDVVQETWIVAAERRPTDGRPLRPWLSRVLVNITRMRARAQQRRESRESATADFVEPATRPDDLVQRVELQRRVAGAVLRLAEPYRSTVLLHYFEELTSAEIARRLELPEGTVRRRLKVALDELRARIGAQERRSGGLAALAPLAGLDAGFPTTAPITVGVIAMKKVVAAVVVLLVLLIAAFVWNARGKDHSASRATSEQARGGATATGVQTPSTTDPQIPAWLSQQRVTARRIAGRVTFRGAPVSGATVELASIASEAGLVTAPRRTTTATGEFDFGAQSAMEWSVRASAPGKASATAEVDLREPHARPAADHLELELGACTAALFGTIRDASGGPIANARVARLTQSRAVPGGASVTSDAKGTYELCVETRWPGWLVVDVSADGYGAIMYRAVVPGRLKVDFALVPEAAIVGRVIRDDNGKPIPHAFVFVPPGPRGLESAPMRAAFSDDSGRFRIDQLTPGRHLVFARAEGMADASTGTPVAVGVGQTSAEIEIRLQAGSTLIGKVVDGDKPVAGARVVAIDALGGHSAVSQDDGTFVIGGVPRTEVRFTAFPYDVVKPESFHVTQSTHEGITIEVESRGAIIGHVVRNNRPVAGANIDIHGPNDDELDEVRADTNGHFEARGLRAGPWTLFASDERQGAFGRAPETVHLARGQTTEITIDIAFAASIAGRVVDQNGSPVPSVTVMFNNTKSDDAGVTATAEDGTFRAAMMTGGGDYRPSVSRSMLSRTPMRPVAGGEFPTIALADGNASVTGVTLAVQLDRLSIAGRVVDSDGAPVPDARITAELVEGNEAPRFGSGAQHSADTTDVDGHFSIDELLAGTYALRARSPGGTEVILANVRAGQSNVTVVLPTPGTLEVTAVGFKASPQVTAIRSDRVTAEQPAFGTQAGNVYTFRNLSPGSYVVSARSTGEAATTTVQVTAARTARATLTSGGSGTVAGHVRDFKTNKPVEGMTCRALPRQGTDYAPAVPGEGVRTDAQGAFLINAAPAGQIVIWCDGLWRNYSTGARLIALEPSQRVDVNVPVVAWSEEAGTTLGGLGAEFDNRVFVARLVAVKPNGPAAVAGFQDGDVIVAVDGASVTELSAEGVRTLVINRAPGSKVKLSALRGSKPVSGEVVLGESPR